MKKYFGTDGIRGVANEELTPELTYKAARAAGYLLTKESENKKIIIGRDTRISGEMLEAALIAGFLSVGMEVVTLGVIPTPAVALATRKLQAAGGVMISASHNPFEDNGIKFFGSDGFKLSDDIEEAMEALMEKSEDIVSVVGGEIGTVHASREAKEMYVKEVLSTTDSDANGLKVVLDCANGATSQVAEMLFSELGAETIVIANEPNGTNINFECGSTHPAQLQEEVLRQNADLGLAFDGDGDRLIAVNERGEIMDGDAILFICADYFQQEGLLQKNAVVSTVMSNYGFAHSLSQKGIQSVQTNVGDKYVMEEMKKSGYNIGGEQSGHLIFTDYSTTGDGLLAAVQLVKVMKNRQKSLAELAKDLTVFPQVLVNVRVKDKTSWRNDEDITKTIEEVEQQLKGKGRLLVRESGTESLVRVMAEGQDYLETKAVVDFLVQKIQHSDQQKNQLQTHA